MYRGNARTHDSFLYSQWTALGSVFGKGGTRSGQWRRAAESIRQTPGNTGTPVASYNKTTATGRDAVRTCAQFNCPAEVDGVGCRHATKETYRRPRVSRFDGVRMKALFGSSRLRRCFVVVGVMGLAVFSSLEKPILPWSVAAGES